MQSTFRPKVDQLLLVSFLCIFWGYICIYIYVYVYIYIYVCMYVCVEICFIISSIFNTICFKSIYGMIRLPILAAWKEFNDLMLALITGNRWKEAFNIFADMRSAWTPRLRSAQNRVPADLQK